MANKKLLIDVDEFAKTFEKTDANVCADYGDGFCEFGYSRSLLRLLLSEAPTVDAVEVVRCKDCKHFAVGGADRPRCRHENGLCDDIEPDHFCSYGEKRGM